MSVNDVAGDQGGYINLKFARSAFDVPLSETGGVNYQIERSVPPNVNGYQWISVATVSGTSNTFYTAEVHTPLDSGISGNNTYYFRITAISNSTGAIWRSNILSGYSIDNLYPLPPLNLMAMQSGNAVNLNWNHNSENDLRQYIIYRNGIQIGTSLTLNFTDNYFSVDSAFSYRIAAEDIHGNISGLSNPANINLISANLNLKIIQEGYFNTAYDMLNIRDTVRAYLHNNTSPYALIDSAISVTDSVSFSAVFRFTYAPDGNYFIAVKHRNTIETWSASGLTLTSGNTVNYDMTSLNSQSYGNNMIQVDNSPVRYAIFSGDVNQDGIIDASDLSETDNDAFNSLSGYIRTDVTGDDFTDAADVSIVDNNSFIQASVVSP